MELAAEQFLTRSMQVGHRILAESLSHDHGRATLVRSEEHVVFVEGHGIDEHRQFHCDLQRHVADGASCHDLEVGYLEQCCLHTHVRLMGWIPPASQNSPEWEDLTKILRQAGHSHRRVQVELQVMNLCNGSCLGFLGGGSQRASHPRNVRVMHLLHQSRHAA